MLSYYKMCALTVECVLLLCNVSSYYRMCSHTVKRDLLSIEEVEEGVAFRRAIDRRRVKKVPHNFCDLSFQPRVLFLVCGFRV